MSTTVHLIRLSLLNADGSVEGMSVMKVDAPDIREAMASVVREQEGWFSVEVMTEPPLEAWQDARGDDGERARTQPET